MSKKNPTDRKTRTDVETETDKKIEALLKDVLILDKNKPSAEDTPLQTDVFKDMSALLKEFINTIRAHSAFYFIHGGQLLVDHRPLNESFLDYKGEATAFSHELSIASGLMRNVLHILKSNVFSHGKNIETFCDTLLETFDTLYEAFGANEILHDPIVSCREALNSYIVETIDSMPSDNTQLVLALRAQLLGVFYQRLQELALSFYKAECLAEDAVQVHAETIRQWESRITAIRNGVPIDELPKVNDRPFFGTPAYRAHERKVLAWYRKEESFANPHGIIREADEDLELAIAPDPNEHLYDELDKRLFAAHDELKSAIIAEAAQTRTVVAKAIHDRSAQPIKKGTMATQLKDAAKILLKAEQEGKDLSFADAIYEYMTHAGITETDLANVGGYTTMESFRSALYKNAERLGIDHLNSGQKGRPRSESDSN